MSASGVHLELHFSLNENEANIDGTLSDCWQYAAAQAGYAYGFTPEFFLFHQFAHADYHFLHGGCGMRIFLDLQILHRRMSFDRETLDALLAKCGILKFANEAMHLADVWFGNAAHTELSVQMERYILDGGVYGTANNRIAVQQVRTGGKLRYTLSRIWLPYAVLRSRYPSLEGRKALLPLYEVRRWCRLLLYGTFKRSVNELRLNLEIADTEQTDIKAMLSALEIGD